MSVYVDFTVDDEQFTLGGVVAGLSPRRIELERIVPTGNTVMPFLWVRGADFEAFETAVASHPAVSDIAALDRLDDSVLYRITWDGEGENLIRCIVDADGAVLEAHTEGNGWRFRLRFLDHDSLSAFYNCCTDRDIRIHIDRTYTLAERSESGYALDLTQQQREALVLGLREGYFETPSRASTEDLAEELGISQQAASDRIRRGTEAVLESVLLSSATDLD